MKVKRKFFKIIVAFVLVSSFLLPSILIKVNAQDTFQEQTGDGISVTPIRVQRNYQGNDKDVITFTLLNNEDTDMNLSVTVKSFKLLNNNTDISFDPTVEETILNWIRNFKNSVVLKPKEKFEYSLELNINADTQPGGYLFGIFFESSAKNDIKDGSGAAIKQSIGVPLIINVAGVEGISYGDVTLDSFDVGYNIISNNVHYSAVVLNNSNQIITPAGVFTLKKDIGIGPDLVTSTFNSQGKIISAFSLRGYDKDVFFNQFAFGRYTASLDFLYGLENNVYSQKTTIWVIPIWIIVLIGIVLFYVAKKLHQKRKQNNND